MHPRSAISILVLIACKHPVREFNRISLISNDAAITEEYMLVWPQTKDNFYA